MTNGEHIIFLQTLKTKIKDYEWYGKGIEASIDAGIEALEKKTDWTPISERLPGMGKCVLVTDDGDEYFKENGLGWAGKATTFACMTENGWEMLDINYDCQLNKITAWQPLPEPWRESEG